MQSGGTAALWLEDDVLGVLPALSREVTHWMTMAENRTADSVRAESAAWSIRLILSQLQHIRQTQPGSPFNAISTERLLTICVSISDTDG